MRRTAVVRAVMVAAGLALAGWSAPAWANPGFADYTLAIPKGFPTPGPDQNHSTVSGPQVIINVIPPQGIVPPPVLNSDGTAKLDAKGNPMEGSPLTILPGSFGFDQSNLLVSLTPPDPSGQLLGLTYFNGGLASSNNLNFQLSVDKTLTTPPQLQVVTPDSVQIPTGVFADKYAPTDTKPQVPPQVATNNPEPFSLALWSVALGVGALRARRRRA